MSTQVLEIESAPSVTSAHPHKHCRRPRRLFLSVYFLTALVAIFWLPYLVPVPRSLSLSYAFGYSNRAGILLILLFTGIAVAWMLRSSVFPEPKSGDSRVSHRTLALTLAGTALILAVAYPLVSSATPVADAAYFINRLQLASIGHRPYIQIEFAYGPLLLYAPLWMAKFLHVGLAQAYYCIWVVAELLGILLLFRVINDIEIRSRLKPTLFVILCAAAGASFILGAVSYTLTRFALPLYCACVVSRNQKAGNHASVSGGLAVLSFIALLLISPEIALAFGLASAAFLFLSGCTRTLAWWGSYAAMMVAMAGATVAANQAHVLDTVKTFSAGVRDCPVIPAGHILLFLSCMFLAVLHAARKIVRREYAVSVYLVLISVAMLPSTLGTCDPLHVFFGGLGFLIVGMLYLGQNKISWDAARLCFCVFFIFVLFTGLALERLYQYGAKLKQLSGNRTDVVSVLREQTFPGSHGVLEAPFGFRPGTTEQFYASWIDTGRYVGTINAPSSRDVVQKEQELKDHADREVLVPSGYQRVCRFDEASRRLWMEVENAAPYPMPLRHSENPYTDFCAFLKNNYHEVQPATARSFKYQLWERNH